MQIEQNGKERDGQQPVASRGSGLSDLAIRRPVFTTMMMLALVVLGVFGFNRLNIARNPDVEFPVVAVQTVYPGASPETIEREVTEPLAEAFNTVQGIDEISSTSLEGVSQVIVFFELERDVDQAAQDIRAELETVRRDLPTDIEEPIVRTFDPEERPILSLALSSETLPPVQLTTLAEETIADRLEAVTGVGEVRVSGGLTREIRVFLQPEQMRALGISVAQVVQTLQQETREVPGGRLERGNEVQFVRVTGRIEDPDQFEDLIVATRDGQPVRLADVARVVDTSEEEQTLALLNGERAVGLDVVKTSDANTVEVAEAAKAAIAEIRQSLGAGVQLEIVRDDSESIQHSIDDAIFELIFGAFLTVIIVMLFLNDRKATAITALTLPISIISAFILMFALGFTLNTITLLALSLSIGILIDDAIVVIENIVRHREMGKGSFLAASDGTREIILAVMATTFSVVAVFVPVAFMGGIVGRFFFQFGITVAWAVLVSLFVAFTLTPMLSAHWGLASHGAEKEEGNVFSRGLARFNRWFDRVAERYRGVIDWALRHRKTTTGVAMASFVGALALFPLIGAGFFPATDDSQFTISFETPDGSSLAYTESKAHQIRTAIEGMETVQYTYTTIGAGQTGTVTAGDVFVKLVPTGERDLSQQEVMNRARQRIAGVYGIDFSIGSGGFGGGAPLAVELRGPSIDELQRLSQVIAEHVREVPGVVDVQNSMGDPVQEYLIRVNRNEASELGVSLQQVGLTVRTLVAGQDVTTWEAPNAEEYDVVVQLPEQRRTSVEDLRSLPLLLPPAADGGAPRSVDLGQITTIELGTAPAQIQRQELQRVATISGGTVPGLSVSDASQRIRQALEEVNLPPGYTVSLGGETEDLQETAGYVIEALLLAVILIYLILASQFGSFTQPLAIMLSLPLSLIGVFLALLITGDTLNMMSMIGVILLMGLVTKNAILLVDNANEQRQVFGRGRFEALVEAGAVRFRPIMMTTLAMIAGMMPIALAIGSGSGARAPMARAVIGGLITSTLLTLVVVPVAYSYLDDFSTWTKRKLGRDEEQQEDIPEGLKPSRQRVTEPA